jgi:hypothetical protein
MKEFLNAELSQIHEEEVIQKFQDGRIQPPKEVMINCGDENKEKAFEIWNDGLAKGYSICCQKEKKEFLLVVNEWAINSYSTLRDALILM